MFNPLNPDGVAPPARKYVHTMTVPQGYKLYPARSEPCRTAPFRTG